MADNSAAATAAWPPPTALALNPVFPALQLFNVYTTKARIYVVGCARVRGGRMGSGLVLLVFYARPLAVSRQFPRAQN